MANNVVRHHVRSEIRRKRLAVAVAADARPAGVAESAESVERRARLAQAIGALPATLREAFVLVYLEGISGTEVAALLGVRAGTVWKRLHQARARLREALGEIDP